MLNALLLTFNSTVFDSFVCWLLISSEVFRSFPAMQLSIVWSIESPLLQLAADSTFWLSLDDSCLKGTFSDTVELVEFCGLFEVGLCVFSQLATLLKAS